MKRVLIFLLMLMPLYSFAQKAEELQNSYNLKRGAELLFAETPDEAGAMECFKKEVSEHPKNGYAYYYMGLIYDNYEQEGNALECFNKAIDFLKKDKDWISYAYRMRGGVNLKLGHDNLALADWKASLKENPDDVATLNDRGDYYNSIGDYISSDADYDRIVKIKPGSTLGYKGKARNAIATHNYQKAIDDLNYAANLDPNDSYVYAFRAEAYIKQGKFNEASDDIIKGIEIDGNRKAYFLVTEFKGQKKNVLLAKSRIKQAVDKNNNVWSWFQGLIYEQDEDYSNAIKLYKAAYDIGASDVCMCRIANCYAELGNYQKALDYIHRAMIMDSTETSYQIDEGQYLYDLGLTRDAIAAMDRYIAKNPDDEEGYYRKANFERETGKTDDAITDYTTAIVLAPDYAHAYFLRGDCYKRSGNTSAAMADYRKVVELDTVYSGSTCVQYAYFELGYKDKAVAWQDTIFAHAQDKGTYYDAACLYTRMGEYDKAMGYLRTALEKGYRDFSHIRADYDLDGLRDRDDFKTLIKEYQQKAVQQQDEMDDDKIAVGAIDLPTQRVSEIPFIRETGGLCKVKCEINGLPLSFWLDTGASDVSLSMVEATFMLKNGYLTKDDVVGSSYFLDANGNVNEGTVLNLRVVKFGDSELNNVKASVVKNLKAPLLLGQSILARLGSVEIDNAKQVIRIKYLK